MLFEDSSAGHLIELIWRIYFFTRKGIDLRMKKLDLTYPQFGTLVALGRKENVSQKKLADTLGTDTTNIMVVCDSLERKKLIKRKPNPLDRRENLIVRTEAGKKSALEAMTIMETYVFGFMGQIKSEEIDSAMPLLKRLHDILIDNEHG